MRVSFHRAPLWILLLILTAFGMSPAARAQDAPGAAEQFNSAAAGLDWTNAYLCMWASRVSLRSFNQASKIIGKDGWGFPCVCPIDNRRTDTQGFAAANDKMILIVFRSTETKYRDWLTDMRFFPHRAAGVCVHSGFEDAFNSIWPDLRKFITDNLVFAGQTKPIFIAGHSLGGALAAIAAVRIKETVPGAGPVEVYSFGSPRVGNEAFTNAARRLGVEPMRFVYRDDVIPYLPWYIHGIAEFGPVGSQIRLDSHGLARSQRIPRTITLYGYRYAMAIANAKGKGFDLFVKDHYSDYYLDSLSLMVDPNVRDKLPRAP